MRERPRRIQNKMSASTSGQPQDHKATAGLAIAAIGVVFGDIGTSPLYALKEAFGPRYDIPLTPDNVMGILSLMVWSLVWVVTIKYLFVIMRADNNGEGGILSLLALALRETGKRPRLKWTVIGLGIFGAAMFYGDSMITPAITVLSAAEGLQTYSPRLAPFVIPFTLVVITVLFLIQRHGTGKVGVFFGPVMVLWFLTLAALGAWHITKNPGVLAALRPAYAVDFFFGYPIAGFFVLGAVFLVLTGGESIFTDMGHFGKRPIRIAWFALVFPALLLNYFGQAAFVLANPEGVKNPFYLMVPDWGILPMVVLATCPIASDV
jgi:KUP system potassium uptake protein